MGRGAGQLRYQLEMLVVAAQATAYACTPLLLMHADTQGATNCLVNMVDASGNLVEPRVAAGPRPSHPPTFPSTLST